MDTVEHEDEGEIDDGRKDQDILEHDGKLSFFEARIAAAFKLKSDKIEKFIRSDLFWKSMVKFLETNKFLYVTETSSGDLEVQLDLTYIPKRKGLIFFRRGEGPISAKLLKFKVCSVEIGPNVVHGILSITKNVFFPMLRIKPESNSQGWSVAITKDVYDKTAKFISNSFVTVGLMTGKTLLPLPPEEIFLSIDKASHNKDSIYALEGVIVTWTEQIRNILSLNSETPLLAGENPGPDVEIEFWSTRAADLNSVHDQLCGSGISRIAKVLEITRSTYFPSFSRLCQEVENARLEANDNLKHLKVLEPYLSKLKAVEFSNILSLIKPIMHIILLIWTHSKFFNTTARIVVLVREICNDIIKRGQEFINSPSMFENDPGETVASLKDCIRICVAFKSIFCDYKSRTNIELVQILN